MHIVFYIGSVDDDDDGGDCDDHIANLPTKIKDRNR